MTSRVLVKGNCVYKWVQLSDKLYRDCFLVNVTDRLPYAK